MGHFQSPVNDGGTGVYSAAHREAARSETSACFIVERIANFTAESLVCAFIPVGILI